jgi:hypothetical protein
VFVSGTPAQFDYNGPYGCQGAPFGAFSTETFQIDDQNGKPLVGGGLIVQEMITNEVTTVDGVSYAGQGTGGRWVPVGPNGITLTNAFGQFIDSPFGGCGTFPATENFTQMYRVLDNGVWYVLTPTLNVMFIGGLGTLTVTTQYFSFSISR